MQEFYSAPRSSTAAQRGALRSTIRPVRALTTLAVLLIGASIPVAAQTPAKAWSHPMTPWGDPDLSGMWPITHLNGTPLQRPAQFGERRVLTDEEFAQRQKQIADTAERTAGAWAEIGQANRLTSLVVEPASGRLQVSLRPAG